MPDLAPFRGLRFTRGPDLSLVTAPPYDVIDDHEREDLEKADDHNTVRLILPQPTADRDAYAVAAATLADWRADGIVRVDDEPALYPYRMTAPLPDGGAHRTVGVIGALALPAAGADDVLPHERTLPKARSDRLALLRATRANLDPIWGLTLSTGLTELLEAFDPVSTAVDEGGVLHEIGVVTDPAALRTIRELVGSRAVVLADGHHRFQTACTYHDEAGGTPGSDTIMCLVVELDDAQLDVRTFHRIIEGPPPDLRERLAGAFAVRDAGPLTPDTIAATLAEMDATGAMGLVDSVGVAVLDPKAEVLEDALVDVPECLHQVDSARFDAAIRPHLDDAPLRYRSGGRAVEMLADDEAAVLLRGVDVGQIRAAADARVLMPEKTTYFAPKPRTGMVMRCLDD